MQTVACKRIEEKQEILAIYPDSVYHMENSPNGGGLMDQKEVFAAAFKELGISQEKAAEAIGWTPRTLSGRVQRGSVAADDFLRIMDAIGIDVMIVDGDTRAKYDSDKVSECLQKMISEAGMLQVEVAQKMEWSPQRFSNKIARDSFKAEEFVSVLNALGKNIEFYVRKTGRELRAYTKGYGRRVRMMVNKVKYDTAAAEVLANNFYADGVNEYNEGKAIELYVDKEGRYFFAEYSSWTVENDNICPVTPSIAADFVERYGTEIFKKPKEPEEVETPSGS